MIAGTVSTVVFAISNLPMLSKALRTRDVSSYSLSSIAMINAANVVYSLYVFTLPAGPIWALHTFYLVSCGIMLVLCLRDGRARSGRHPSRRRSAQGASTRWTAPVRARIASATAIASPSGASDFRSGRARKR